jgi:hypothetical protein
MAGRPRSPDAWRATPATGRCSRGLGQDDVTGIEAFLLSLTDRRFVSDERFSLPRKFCGRARTR